MKLYIVYFRTMQDSPEVEILLATTDEQLAKEKFKKAKEEEAEWMEDQDEDSGNWAEACMKSFDITEERKPGDTIFVFVETIWCDGVETTISPFLYEINATEHLSCRKENTLNEHPSLIPFDGNESKEEAMHFVDESYMEDVYFSIKQVVIK